VNNGDKLSVFLKVAAEAVDTMAVHDGSEIAGLIARRTLLEGIRASVEIERIAGEK